MKLSIQVTTLIIKNFSKIQLAALVRLSKFLIKKYRINSKNILGHSDIAPERKKDPGEKFPWKLLSKKKIGYWHNLNQNELIKNRNLETSSKEKIYFLPIYLKLDIKKNFYTIQISIA